MYVCLLPISQHHTDIIDWETCVKSNLVEKVRNLPAAMVGPEQGYCTAYNIGLLYIIQILSCCHVKTQYGITLVTVGVCQISKNICH